MPKKRWGEMGRKRKVQALQQHRRRQLTSPPHAVGISARHALLYAQPESRLHYTTCSFGLLLGDQQPKEKSQSIHQVHSFAPQPTQHLDRSSRIHTHNHTHTLDAWNHKRIRCGHKIDVPSLPKHCLRLTQSANGCQHDAAITAPICLDAHPPAPTK